MAQQSISKEDPGLPSLTLYRSYDPYMGHKRFFHCHAEKVGT
jgi:hypothetical protein